MCRIAGFWNIQGAAASTSRPLLAQMRDVLAYGGPDSAGEFFDQNDRLALGHRRLSIIDLSSAGSQPMTYKHWTIVFNGEIYNYQTIRAELQTLGHTFATHTDTEVILQGFERWGMDVVQRFRGMFAFALWDAQAQQLTLVRDRLGVKPLYYSYDKGVLLFSSELKSFHAAPHFDKTLDSAAVAQYLQYGYVPQTHCIFAKARRLAAGSYAVFGAEGLQCVQTYWSVEQAYLQPQILPTQERDLLEHIEQQLVESFRLRMVADVPVGAFLSGGIDSSLVVALLQKHSNTTLKTFTIGFEDKQYNEAHHARQVAQHLQTDHTELYCTERDFLNIVPQLSELYDEPFGDSSAVPTHLVAALANQQVKVSLSADGGDELFGGYTKYEATQRFYPRIQRFPAGLRAMGAGVLGRVNPFWVERNAAWLPVLGRYKNLSHKLPKLLHALQASSMLEFFQLSSLYVPDAKVRELLPNLGASPSRYSPTFAPEAGRVLAYLGMVDMRTYLEGDILTKVDRATMRVALEGREPFLDHTLVELALSLDDVYKIRDGQTKYALRQILYKYVPQTMIERPKQGFSVPIATWLQTVLRAEVDAMANDANFAQALQFDAQALRQWIATFQAQRQFVNPHAVWFMYMLWAWWKRWGG